MTIPQPIDTDPAARVCAVCGYVLEHIGSRDGSHVDEYVHLRSGANDHVIVPVKPSDIEYNKRCDFCDVLLDDPPWVVIADDFIYTAPAGQQWSPNLPVPRSRGNWAACAECGPLVRDHKWMTLAIRRKRQPTVTPAMMPALIQMYRDLQEHMHEVLPIGEWRQRHSVAE